ncbi:MAG: carboxypeptidase regulatory-like domain-containing protein [Syntrophothermus sp.]
MKKILFPLFILILAFKFVSCEFGVDEATNNPSTPTSVTINGQIVESTTGDAISNASIKITDGKNSVNTTTGSNGKFSIALELPNDEQLTIISFKEGYTNDTTSVFARQGDTIYVPIIALLKQQGTGGGNSSTGAASIYMYSQSGQSIGVRESGSNETAQIIFEVLDSSGVAINSDNPVVVNFLFGAKPNGGEYLYPSSVQTNALGRAAVTLNTGTIAGVTQVIAEFTVNGIVIRSKPVLISIHGGFPDENHFAVACEKLNYPEWGVIGFQIPFTAFVGDKYTNPVRPGTSVYFSATSGIVQGSNQTDELGRSTVTLLTQPNPNHSTFGPGFFEVKASTINENQTSIFTSTVRLLSGAPIITVNPTTFDIANGSEAFFNYTVSDGNGNPLAEGTTIGVKVVEGNIKLSGNVDVKLPDTQSKAFTTFSFSAYDSQPDSNKVQRAVISIKTSGPNGDNEYTLSGTSR